MLRLLRSRAVRGVLALTALSVPAGVATAGSTEPDDSSPDSAAPEDTSVTNTDGDASAPPNGTAPEGSAAEGDGGITAPSADDIQFEIDMMLGLVPQEEMEQYWAEQEEEQQLAVQACMNESGFDYEIENYPVMMGGPGGTRRGTAGVRRAVRLRDLDDHGSRVERRWTWRWSTRRRTTRSSTRSPPRSRTRGTRSQMRCQNESYAGQDDIVPQPRCPTDHGGLLFGRRERSTDTRRPGRLGRLHGGSSASRTRPGGDVRGRQRRRRRETTSCTTSSTSRRRGSSHPTTTPSGRPWSTHEIEIAVANARCEPAITETREEVQRDLRDDLIAVWQTIDWSQPPVTYEGEGDVSLMPGESLPAGSDVPEGSTAETTEAGDHARGQRGAAGRSRPRRPHRDHRGVGAPGRDDSPDLGRTDSVP